MNTMLKRIYILLKYFCALILPTQVIHSQATQRSQLQKVNSLQL